MTTDPPPPHGWISSTGDHAWLDLGTLRIDVRSRPTGGWRWGLTEPGGRETMDGLADSMADAMRAAFWAAERS